MNREGRIVGDESNASGMVTTTRRNVPPPPRQTEKQQEQKRQQKQQRQTGQKSRNGRTVSPRRPNNAAVTRRRTSNHHHHHRPPTPRDPCPCFATTRRSTLVTGIGFCLLLLYGIAMVAYVVLLQSRHHRTIHHVPSRFRPPSVGMTKEEQRERLQKLQRERLENRSPRGGGAAPLAVDPHHKPTSNKTVTFARKYARMIHFLHIHKSAGTFLCKQAFRNKMAADYTRNCNVRDDQRCCWIGDGIPGGDAEGAERAIRFAETAPYDFVASEKELAGPMLPDHYDYVLTLRESRARYKSHWQHLKRDAERRKRELKDYRRRVQKKLPAIKAPAHRGKGYAVSGVDLGPGGEEPTTPPAKPGWLSGAAAWLWPNAIRTEGRAKRADTGDGDRDPVHWNLTIPDPEDGRLHPVGNYTKWIRGQPDNYALRMVCGTPCAEIPKYGIPRELFERALERLWTNVSHVLFVEDLEASYARFARAYGWTAGYSDDRPDDAKARPPKANRTLGGPLAGDPHMTVLDDALYELALRKQHERPQQPASRNNATVPDRPVWTGDDAAPFRNQEAIEAYFREGPRRNCTNPCCGYCSKW